MANNSFTRRRFMLISAGAATLAAAPNSDGVNIVFADAPGNSQGSVISHQSSTNSEMGMAQAWARAFRLPGAKSAPTQNELLRDVLEPPFSFVYGERQSADLLPTWKFEVKDSDLDATKRQQEAIYTDPDTGLAVRAVATIFKDFPAVEWVMHFKNTGSADTPILQNVQPLNASLSSADGDPTIHYSRGAACSPSDFMPMTRVLGKRGGLHLQLGGGRSSSQFLPFFNIETKKEGAILAIGWSGEWAAAFDRPEVGPNFQVKAGMALTHLKLHPGEEIRTPRILMLFWQGQRTRGHNLLRQFILAHHRPVSGGKTLQVPMTNHNWGATPASDHMENIRQIIAHDLPMDYYWIDAEWFGQGPWWKNVGNWEAKKDLYPLGLKPISDLLHSSGRKLLLWFEPERVCEGTPWYTEHAQWLLDVPKDKRVYRGFDGKGDWDIPQSDPRWIPNESERNQIQENDRLFNLAIPEARQFLTDFISHKIDEFGLDCFRNDSNIAPLQFWRAADTPDRQGITEIRWIEGFYAFWDELLRRHPKLIIDDCASGGRRIDLETIGRSTAFSRTDFVGDILANQNHSYGLLNWVPLNTTSAGNLSTGNEYRIRSTMTSGLSYGLFTSGDRPQRKADYDNFPFAEVKRSLEQYRLIAKYFYGDYYPLTEYTQTTDAWMAYQLDLPNQGEGMVVALKRPLADYSRASLPLKAILVDSPYEITNVDTGERKIVTGRELTDKGIEVRLLKAPDSALLIYHRRV
jgi:alpha-galactosidase